MLRKMKPGQPGRKRLLTQYGAQLIYVRYRYDAQTRKRIKTIEIAIEETDWVPPTQRFAADEVVWLRIGFVDRPTAQKICAAGGKWDGERCVWQIRYDAAVTLGFTRHVERRNVSL